MLMRLCYAFGYATQMNCGDALPQRSPRSAAAFRTRLKLLIANTLKMQNNLHGPRDVFCWSVATPNLAAP